VTSEMMMLQNFSELALTRRSIRKFEDQDIPVSKIEELIKIAVSAPSGCNSQCWKFVAIHDKAMITQIEAAVIKKIAEIVEILQPELPEEYLTSKRKTVGFFTKAPVVVAVFMTDYHYYDPVLESAFKAYGINDEEMMKLFARPDILSIGAAVQNLLLAIHEKGYGACWMNEPAVAGEEISKILKMPLDYKFMCLIPIGVSAYTPREKKLKEFGEIFVSI
jgi:nitroreductase